MTHKSDDRAASLEFFFFRDDGRWRRDDNLFDLVNASAFFAPPFSGLDTLPALGVVIISLGVLLEDFLIVAVGLAIGLGGILVEVLLGKAAFNGASHML